MEESPVSIKKTRSMFHIASKKKSHLRETLLELQTRNRWLEDERLRLMHLQRQTANQLIDNQSMLLLEANPTGWKTVKKQFNVKYDQRKCPIRNLGLEFFVQDEQPGADKKQDKMPRLVVNGFARHPVTGEPGQLEESGNVKICDYLVAINNKRVFTQEDAENQFLKACVVELRFLRVLAYEPETSGGGALSMDELLRKQKHLESELAKAQRRCDQLDIGALEGLEEALQESRTELATFKEYVGKLEEQMRDKEREIKKLLDVIIDLKGAIRVYVRIRPVGKEKTQEASVEWKRENVVVTSPIDRTVVVSALDSLSKGMKTQTPNKKRIKEYSFDTVFGMDTSQEDVYKDVEPLIKSVIDGYNACVFAYGQTGSGKTYTMSGDGGKLRGINYRAVETLFQMVEEYEAEALVNTSYDISLSLVEIYQETLRDLICIETEPSSLEIMHHPENGFVFVEGLAERSVSSPEEVFSLLSQGSKNRVVGLTNMNERSSRSHMVVLLTVTTRVNGKSKSSKLQLIDLAGSERLNKSGATGTCLKETGAINKSLAALGNVMHALQTNELRQHIPFRDSKLTSLLRDSLGGNTKTLVLIQVNPLKEHLQETLCSLEFAQRVAKIRLGSLPLLSNAAPLQQLKDETTRLRCQNESLRQELAGVTRKLAVHAQSREEHRREEDREDDSENHSRQANVDSAQMMLENKHLKTRNQELKRELDEMRRKNETLERTTGLKATWDEKQNMLIKENNELRRRLREVMSANASPSRTTPIKPSATRGGSHRKVSIYTPTVSSESKSKRRIFN